MSPSAAVPLTLTANAARRIHELVAAEGQSGMMLRLAISGGGCSGYQYGFTLDDAVNPDDRLVIDDVSLGMLGGAEIDFVEELVGSAFTVRNPNAASSCGCGNSFAV